MTSKKPQVPGTYDQLFAEGGHSGVFNLPYRRSGYYPMFKAVHDELRRLRTKQVLEVGCGTGALANLILDKGGIGYRGFDFSSVAVAKARERTGRGDLFGLGDATASQTYAGVEVDTIVCTEVLEHIEDDLLAIQHWPAGVRCICSVPNYDADTHVRHFRSEDEVQARYGGLVEIERIQRRNKPFLDDFTWTNWLRAVKWNRYRADRLMWLLGRSDFDRDGGWFIFTGRRRA